MNWRLNNAVMGLARFDHPVRQGVASPALPASNGKLSRTRVLRNDGPARSSKALVVELSRALPQGS
jgi:hypothetical protein